MTDTPVSISLKTTGCRVNQADSEAIVEGLADLPVHWVAPSAPAHISVVNACTVTGPAERDGRNSVYRALRSGKGPVFLTGCMAVRLSSQDVADPFEQRVRVVSGDALVKALREAVLEIARDDGSTIGGPDVAGPGEPLEGTSACSGTHKPVSSRPIRSRPIVKVQDGCDGRCSYCIVPLVRGPSRSVPPDRIADEVGEHAAKGAWEVVLAGVDLASWGRGGDQRLPDLLNRLLGMKTGVRFRLSSIEPEGLDERLLGLIGESSDICPHLHVPMQSGSDRVLTAMERPYGARDFERMVDRAHAMIDGLSMGLDVICGFPAEDDREFERTHAFLRSLPFTYLHVFPYSPRPGTRAFESGDPVPHHVKRQRCSILRELSNKRRTARVASRVGTRAEVVDIRTRDGVGVESIAEDYTKVLRRGADSLIAGRILVDITGAEGQTAIANGD
ncbi:MAG: MiaB/RimO family radical SAM methylthiotransferase [Deltaproteobacteria bacterium]|nr:MiaB/RimO family radical SAM methylthiotransferase [Deltaproteobacteria bacterium]